MKEVIAEGVEVQELGPCTLCNEELFLSIIKQPFTTLPCSHIFHRACLEKSIINGIEICPANDCFKSFELGFEDIEASELPAFSSQDSMSIPMQISPQIVSGQNQGATISEAMANHSSIPILSQLSLYPDYTKQIQSNKPKSKGFDMAEEFYKRPLEVTTEETTTMNDKSSNKKAKKEVKNGDSSMLKKLIKELSSPSSSSTTSLPTITSPGNFTDLYDAIIKAEERIGSTNQEVIRAYFLFGKKLEEKLAEYIKTNKERKAQRLLTKEVSAQLPSDLSKNAVEKRIERARKIYDLFTTIGEDKIERVKSYSALRISKLSWNEIDAIVEKFES